MLHDSDIYRYSLQGKAVAHPDRSMTVDFRGLAIVGQRWYTIQLAVVGVQVLSVKSQDTGVD